MNTSPGSRPHDPDGGVPEPPGAARCGNGRWEDGETCDDGNTADGDGCSADCQVASCLVPVTHATVQAGVDDTGCEVLYLYSGDYAEHVVVDRARLTVEAVGNAPVIVDGGGAGRVFDIQGGHILLRGFEIRGGRAARGAGIHVQGASLTLERMVVRGNIAAAEIHAAGGGIYSDGSTLLLRRTEILGNRVTCTGPTAGSERAPVATGGGIHAVAPGSVTLTGRSRVADNQVALSHAHAVGRGAGISAVDVTTSIGGGSAVEDNLVDVDSGAAPASAEAGGILQIRGSVRMDERSRVAENAARARGAAGSEDSGRSDDIDDWARPSVIVREPVTIARGGGLVLLGAQLTATGGSRIEGNLAAAESTGLAESSGGGVYLAGVSGGDEPCAQMHAAGATVSRNQTRAFSSAAQAQARADARGGAIHAWAAPSACVALELGDSAIAGNLAEARAASATAGGTARGGGLSGIAMGGGTGPLDVTIARSTLHDNTARAHGRVEGGGLHVEARSGARLALRIDRSALSGNLAQSRDADARGGALHAAARGRGETELSLALSSSTVSGNLGASTTGHGYGGALYALATDSARVAAELESMTIAENMASTTAGGLYATRGDGRAAGASDNASAVSLHNTILAMNTAPEDANCVTEATQLTSRGYNLIHYAGRCSISGDTAEDLYHVDPRLAPLSNNGGPTWTHALQQGSPAIDAGDPAACPEVDQRGLPRARCDIGAFEHAP